MGKLIVLEGGDAAGKRTQTDLLEGVLVSEGLRVTVRDYPRYEEFYGQLIKEALHGLHGDFRHLSPKLAALPYILDRVCDRHTIKQALDSNDVVICNRYMESNMAFCMARVEDEDERLKLVHWLYQAEHVALRLIPESDLVIFLDTELDVSGQLLDRRGEGRDQHEADRAFQASVLECYRMLARSFSFKWRMVKCVSDGEIRTKEAIHQEVLGVVSAFMGVAR